MADNTLFLQPDQPFVQTIRYKTDVIRSLNGKEQRIALRTLPRQQYDTRVLLPDEASIRKWRAALYRDITSNLKLPLWQEVVRTTVDHGSGTTTFTGDFMYTDLEVGDPVLVMSADEAVYEELSVVNITATTLTTASTTNAFAAGSLVLPLENAQIPDGATYSRYPTLAAQMNLTLDLKVQRNLDRGLGSPSPIVYKTMNVLDRKHLNDALTDNQFNWNVTRIDFGDAFTVKTDRLSADIATKRRFLIQSRSELKWWKTFIHAAKGMQEPFWAPTWRPDLVLYEQPSIGGSTIRVTNEPHWKNEYETTDPYGELQLETDGGILYRGVASSVDNFDGTITLTLDAALPGDAASSTINVISFLEQSRFDSDDFRFEHFSAFTRLQTGVRTIRQ